MNLLEIKNEFAYKWEQERKIFLAKMAHETVTRVKCQQTNAGILTLDIEPTNDCNLGCLMCCRTVLGYNNFGKYKIGYMDMNLFRSIIDQAIELGTLAIRLAWYGEPLLHPNIADMVEYTKKKGIADVGFNTNAVYLDKNKTLKLIATGLDRLVFSIDSPYKEQYEKIRIGAHFESVVANIKQFNLLRDQLKANYLLTRATLVLMDENKNSVDDFVMLLKDFVDVIMTGIFHDFNALSDETTRELAQKKFACPYLWTSMVIGWDGKVYVCSIDGDREYCVGSAKDKSLKDIWNSRHYTAIREKHLLGKYNDIPICKKCNLINYFLKTYEI